VGETEGFVVGMQDGELEVGGIDGLTVGELVGTEVCGDVEGR